ncbi:unnamed protein product, partial [Brassica oleracea var. botrytis]
DKNAFTRESLNSIAENLVADDRPNKETWTPLSLLLKPFNKKWSKRNKTLGAAWVLKNCGGEILLHSRRVFANVEFFVDAKFLALLWATESMQSHHVTKVIFEVDFADLVGAVTKPKAWPAFRYQGVELKKSLVNFQEWTILVVSSRANRCAQAIAKSVTREKRFQSYVAMGNPQWVEFHARCPLETFRMFY